MSGAAEAAAADSAGSGPGRGSAATAAVVVDVMSAAAMVAARPSPAGILFHRALIIVPHNSVAGLPIFLCVGVTDPGAAGKGQHRVQQNQLHHAALAHDISPVRNQPA